MSLFLVFSFLFFLGSIIGWISELLYSKIVLKRLVNPGFFVGPWVPIHGFGLCLATMFYIIFAKYNIPIIVILLMGFSMTILELVAGLILEKMNVKIWDYSDRWGNYKGIVCPYFSTIWLIVSAIYYYLFAPYVLNLLTWVSKHLEFSFIIGIFIGLFIIDFIYSFNLLVKIRKYAKEKNVIIKIEELKQSIKERKEREKKKYSFIFALKQDKTIEENLKNYKKQK